MEKQIDEVEGFVLAIAQWVIKEELSKTLNEMNFFITKIFISNIELNQSSILENKLNGNFKSFKVEINFITLCEPQFDRGGHIIPTPSVKGEIIFKKIIKNDFAYWGPYRLELEIKNYKETTSFKHFSYFKPYKHPKGEMFESVRVKKEKFEDFCQKYSRITFPLGVSIYQEI